MNPSDLAITWGPALQMSNQIGLGYGANEPGASMHPTNLFLALAGGNTYEPQPTHGNVELPSMPYRLGIADGAQLFGLRRRCAAMARGQYQRRKQRHLH